MLLNPADQNGVPARLVGRDRTLNHHGRVIWDSPTTGSFYPHDTSGIIGPDMYVLQAGDKILRVEVSAAPSGMEPLGHAIRVLPEEPVRG